MFLKNKGPLLVDKVRGYFDRLPPWLREQITVRIEKQKVDAKIDDLDPLALASELTQELTDEKLRKNTFLGDGEVGSGNDLGALPATNVSEIVITGTGQVADVTETVGQTETHLVEGPPLQDGQSEQVGDLWVTKKVEAPTFDDKVYQLERADLIPQEFRALIPEKLEAHTIDGNAALPTLGSGETVRREEQKKVGVKTVTVQSRDTTTPAVLAGKRFDPDWLGARLVMDQRIVPVGTQITQPFGTTSVTLKPIDGVNALMETWKVDIAPAVFPTLILWSYNTELLIQQQTELSIIPEGEVYTFDTLDLDRQDKKIDDVHSLRQVDKITALPNSYNTYTTQMITFPGILSFLSFALVALADANRKEPQWTAGIRAPYTAPASIRTLTEFFTSEPAPISTLSWATTDIIFKGLSYSINLSNVLTDTWTSIGVTYAADAYYGNAVDRFSISATSPSATAYTSAIGTEAPLSCVIDRYKRLWVRKTSYVVRK